MKSLEVLALAGWLCACSNAPDESLVTQVVEERLASAFESSTFSLSTLRRLGSGPLPRAADGRQQQIVYYNAVLALGRDLDFSAWDALNFAAFANLLGATKQGVTGLKQGGNKKGDRIYVYGTASFVRDSGGWAPVAYVSPGVGTPATEYNTGPPSEPRQLIEKLSSLFDRKTVDPQQQRVIIREELDHAYSAIEIRLDRLDRAFIVAGGPEGAEYVKVAEVLARALTHRGTAASAVLSSGSAENVRLMRTGRADVGLVQNDIATLAALGAGPFEREGPHYELRALASLFPEPIHVMVAKGSPLKDIRDLAGRRVEIGQPGSGSRINSISLLNAIGVSLDNLKAVHESGLEQGLKMLSRGRIDAVIATVSAPARGVQEATAANRIRFLSLPPNVQDELTTASPVFVPIQLPGSTYPNQRDTISTVAVTALLVGLDSLSEHEVDQVLRTVFDEVNFLSAGSAAGSRINRSSARIGVTIPMHPAAIKFFGESGTGAAPRANGN